MSSSIRAIQFLICLCLCASRATCYYREVQGFQKINELEGKPVIFNRKPISNNTLVYAVCNITDVTTFINCTVILEMFPTSANTQRKSCHVLYEVDDAMAINTGQRRLKYLFDHRVILAWTEQEVQKGVPELSVSRITFWIIDMDTCQIVNSIIPFHVTRQRLIDVDDFHIVPYEETFDVFFYNETLCGLKMCGQTYDVRGRVINGPMASYLPADYLNDTVFVYSVKPRSPMMGHFFLSSNMYVVSSYCGQIKQLMEYPSDVEALAFSCNNAMFGFCWSSLSVDKRIRCNQFNSRGDQTANISIHLEYRPGSWMALYNLANGDILLLTNQCNDREWCLRFVDPVTFYLVIVSKDGHVKNVHEMRGINCNSALRIATDVTEKDNGDLCVTFACHVEESVNLVSKCYSENLDEDT